MIRTGINRIARRVRAFAIPLVVLLLAAQIALAQTTAFTYQGKLSDNGAPANGAYDFTLTLWDAPANGAQVGPTLSLSNTPVTDGIFTVALDFGAGAFNGASRYLQITVKPSGSGVTPTLLQPRQAVLSTPYAIKSQGAVSADSLSAVCIGCVTATHILSVSASQITTGTLATARGGTGLASAGAAGNFLRSNGSNWTSSALQVGDVPDLGSAYIKNSSATPQPNASFNISGNGTAGGTLSGNIVNATQYNIGGNRILGIYGTTNLFAGIGAGQSNTSGALNAFFGKNAGQANTEGTGNSFFGSSAGLANTTGDGNAFFGESAGAANIDGFDNTFVGSAAGQSNQSGYLNSFFGNGAGYVNTDGSENAFFGAGAGVSNTQGQFNVFFGSKAGLKTTTGNDNAFLGKSAGANNETGGNNTFVGAFAGHLTSTGSYNTVIGYSADVTINNLDHATAIGAESEVAASSTIALGRSNGSDKVVVYGLGVAGITSLCRNALNQISTCSSSLRYKTDVQTFSGGLNIVQRLRPITFTWKEGGNRDIGFGAEEVAQVEPRLTFRNPQGEIEGVKYSQISAVLVNAVNEQQAQIAAQQKQIDDLKQVRAENTQLRAQLVAIAARLCRLERRHARRR